MVALAFLSAGVAGFFGAMLNKYAPIRGGAWQRTDDHGDSHDAERGEGVPASGRAVDPTVLAVAIGSGGSAGSACLPAMAGRRWRTY